MQKMGWFGWLGALKVMGNVTIQYSAYNFNRNYAAKDLSEIPPVIIGDFRQIARYISTRSSAVAEGPRDASCQLKSCQLARNSTKTTCTTSREQIEVMKLEGYSGPMSNKHVHSTVTRPQCRNCSYDPGHAHLGNTHSSQD